MHMERFKGYCFSWGYSIPSFISWNIHFLPKCNHAAWNSSLTTFLRSTVTSTVALGTDLKVKISYPDHIYFNIPKSWPLHYLLGFLILGRRRQHWGNNLFSLPFKSLWFLRSDTQIPLYLFRFSSDCYLYCTLVSIYRNHVFLLFKCWLAVCAAVRNVAEGE